jgi:zinc protease
MKLFDTKSILALLILMIATLAPINSEASERKLTKRTLENGLNVIIEEDHKAPVVALQMWVRVGSADETDNEAGIAHVFEHMLFKGTSTKEVGELAKLIDSAGGYINAYTSYDQTVYHLAVASRFFDIGLDVLSDAVQNSSFDPDELAKELEVVFEEIKRGEDSPSRKLFSTLMKNAYSSHSYRRPVIGSKETVESFTRAEILAFFKKWYIPNNMTLVVVGDIDSDTALREIEKSFKGFKKRKDPKTPRIIEPQQRETRTATVSQPITQSRISLGYHIEALEHVDTYALDMLSVILGHGKSSRLFRELKINRELVDGVSSYSMTPRDPGMFIVNALLNAEDIDEATIAILNEIGKLSTEGPTQAEMKRALRTLESDFIYERETMEGKASQLGYYETVSGDLKFEEKYITGIRNVNPSDIKLMIRKYLISDNLTLALLLNKDKAELVNIENLTSLIKESSGALKLAHKETRELTEEKGTEVITLDSGITLILKEVHSNPTVAFYATFPGGLRSETKKTNGIGFFTASMLSRGTRRWTRTELAAEIEGLAADVSAFSGNNTIGISGKFMSKDFDRGLLIIAEMLNNPSLSSSEIKILKEDVIAAINRDADNLPGEAFKKLRAVLYEEHPYSLPLKGTIETVNSFSRRDIKKHIKRHFNTRRMVFAIVGDFDMEAAIEKIETLFGTSMRKNRKTKKIEIKSAPGIGEGGIRKSALVKDKEQTHIAIGFPGTTILSSDRLPLSILNEVLSGQGGRLFVDLRDKQSLAYSVSAFSSPGVDPGLFGVYIATSPEKVEKATSELIRLLEEVRENGITKKELARAKSSLIGTYEISLQNVGSQASDMAINELLGLGFNYNSKYAELINGVTEKDVIEAARKYLTVDSYVISVVGPNGIEESK